MKEVICQRWFESERGWGQRPDGISVHVSMTDYEDFLKLEGPKEREIVPDEYSMPIEPPFRMSVSDDAFKGLSLACQVEGRKGIFVNGTSWVLEPEMLEAYAKKEFD